MNTRARKRLKEREETKLPSCVKQVDELYSRNQLERLYAALTAGTLRYLILKDVLMTLSVSILYYKDELLAATVMREIVETNRHIHEKLKPYNWLKALFPILEVIDPSEDYNAHIPIYPIKPTYQYLSAVGMMQHFILPMCHEIRQVNTFHDTCVLVPILLPLHEVVPSVNNNFEWNVDTIRMALNNLSTNLGDKFCAPPSTYIHVSDFGAHWENMHLKELNSPKSLAESLQCGFCTASSEAIIEYRKEAKLQLKEWNKILKQKKEEWKRSGYNEWDIVSLRNELKADMFPEDTYPDINFADASDDNILADICESDQFPMDPFANMCERFDRPKDDIFHALGEEYLRLCGWVYQPLAYALKKFTNILGARVPRLSDEENANEENANEIGCELVAGVRSSGILCGVAYITIRSE